MAKKLLKLGLSTIGSSIVIGSIPNISGTATETTIKTKTTEGLGNVASIFPAIGKLKGGGLILKSTKKLRKGAGKII